MSTAPYVLGSLAGLALLKTFFRPHRAVVRAGQVDSCPGKNRYGACDASLSILTDPGTGVHATAGGRVAAVGNRFVHLAAHDEPVLLMYDGVTPARGLVEGQYVGRGQLLGESVGHVYFSVTQVEPGGGIVKIDPASWLAARGQRIASAYTGAATSWCEQGRSISVPRDAGRACSLHEPDRSSFALLPVTVSVER